ncbi:uncharacterized protein ACIQIH_010497 isoform 1-T4 [Cyanocitta cristata]
MSRREKWCVLFSETVHVQGFDQVRGYHHTGGGAPSLAKPPPPLKYTAESPAAPRRAAGGRERGRGRERDTALHRISWSITQPFLLIWEEIMQGNLSRVKKEVQRGGAHTTFQGTGLVDFFHLGRMREQ